MVQSLPYSLLLRAKRIVSNSEEVDGTLLKMAEGFSERGYPQKVRQAKKQGVGS